MKSMKHVMALSAVLLLILASSSIFAQGTVTARAQNRQGVVDVNRDGICDITGQKIGSGTNGQGQQAGNAKRNGPGDGTGNQGSGPKDGTGYGSQTGRKLGPQDGSQARIGQTNRTTAGGAGNGARIRKGGKR